MNTDSSSASHSTVATQATQTQNSTTVSFRFYRPTPGNTPDFWPWLLWALVICGFITGIEAHYQYLRYHKLDYKNLSYFRWALWLLYIVLVLVFLPLVAVVYMTRYFRGEWDWLVRGPDADREGEGIELEEVTQSV